MLHTSIVVRARVRAYVPDRGSSLPSAPCPLSLLYCALNPLLRPHRTFDLLLFNRTVHGRPTGLALRHGLSALHTSLRGQTHLRRLHTRCSPLAYSQFSTRLISHTRQQHPPLCSRFCKLRRGARATSCRRRMMPVACAHVRRRLLVRYQHSFLAHALMISLQASNSPSHRDPHSPAGGHVRASPAP